MVKVKALTGHTILSIVGGVDELDSCAVRHCQREDVQERQETNPAIVSALKREGFLNMPDIFRYLGPVAARWQTS